MKDDKDLPIKTRVLLDDTTFIFLVIEPDANLGETLRRIILLTLEHGLGFGDLLLA